jgi:hypothetical protein
MVLLLAIVSGAGAVIVLTTGVSAETSWRQLVQDGDISRHVSPLLLNPVTVPAQVLPLGNDPLHVCDGKRVAFLLGRNSQSAFLLFRQPGSGASAVSVMPMRNDEYAIVTGMSSAISCLRPE